MAGIFCSWRAKAWCVPPPLTAVSLPTNIYSALLHNLLLLCRNLMFGGILRLLLCRLLDNVTTLRVTPMRTPAYYDKLTHYA